MLRTNESRPRSQQAVALCALFLCAGSVAASGDDFVADIRALRPEALPSLSVSVVRAGAVYKVAHIDSKGEPPPIYMIASVSKPVIGLAIAHALHAGLVSLDEDVNTYLRWTPRLAHPRFPEAKITLRQLAQHRSGIGRDASFSYDTYPKPDPDVPLNAFMQKWAGPRGRWLETAPGEAYAYSNLGASLAGLVVEAAAGVPFDVYCTKHLFDPLDMADSAWTLGAFNPAQRARVQLPHRAGGKALKQYGFNDYPSGLLRTTALDFAALIGALSSRKAPRLSPKIIQTFKGDRLFLQSAEVGGVSAFKHNGNEAGVIASFCYRKDGFGWFYAANGEFADDAKYWEFRAELEARLLEEAP